MEILVKRENVFACKMIDKICSDYTLINSFFRLMHQNSITTFIIIDLLHY